MADSKQSVDADPSWRTSSKGLSLASSSAWACSTCVSAGSWAKACRTRAVLPIPASPSTNTTPGRPVRAA